MLPVIIVVGLKAGVFTPTEAGVVACVYSILVGLFVYRELSLRQLYGCMVGAIHTTAAVMLLCAAAAITAYLIAIANIPMLLGGWLGGLQDNPLLLMALIMLIVVIVGTALDFIPTILILTPVLLPIIKAAGIDPVYFGVMLIMNSAIGLITPPVGTVLNVVCAVARIKYVDAVRGVMPFLIAETALLVLLILFPQLITEPLAWFY